MSFIEQTNDHKQTALHCDAIVDTLSRIIRRPCDWTTTEGIANELRRRLAIVDYLGQLRAYWKRYVEQKNRHISDCIGRYRHNRGLGVDIYGSGWNRGRYNADDLRANAGRFFVDLCSRDSFHDAKTTEEQFRKRAEQTEEITSQAIRFAADYPDYKTIKKLLPIGGRQAISALMVFDVGRDDRNQSNENYLFGMDETAERIAIRCRNAKRDIIDRAVEKRGKAPSFAAGTRISMIDLLANSESVANHNLCIRRSIFSAYTAKRMRDNGVTIPENGWRSLPVVSGGQTISPSLIVLMRTCSNEQIDKQANRSWGIVDKIAGIATRSEWRNHVPTKLIGKVERLQGDDYVCEAVWYTKEHGKQSGKVFFRRNWPDCFHLSQEEVDTLGDTLANTVSSRIDDSSRWYFQRQEQNELARLTRRQRIARILKATRRIDTIQRDDSYRAGNCKPGTADFIAHLRIEGDEITGRQLARRWKQSDYYQVDRFAAVVSRKERIV